MKEIERIYRENQAKPDESLYNHTKLLLDQLETIKDIGYLNKDTYGNNIEDLVYLACLYHDSGKINDYFQERVKVDKNQRFDEKTEVGHNILSAYLTMHLLEDEKYSYLNAKEKDIIINAVLNHHHYIKNYDSLKDDKDKIENNLIEIGKNYSVFENLNPKKMNAKKIMTLRSLRADKRYIFVKGLLHKCDYSASAHIEAEIGNDFLLERMDSKGFEWNKLQEYCRDKSEENIVIIGSTGIGKTEASLLWAGNNKIFYVLPLRTAINAMYIRIKRDFVSQDYDNKLGLLHGETASQYLSMENGRGIDVEDENEKFYRYYDLTKNMALPLTISTPDQIFNFVFKYNGYELKLVTLAYSRIIIDEIQAYSPDILAYTIHAISEVARYGGKFAIFTATLAPFVKDLLVERLGNINFDENVFLTEEVRHKMKVDDSSISADFICDFVKNNMDEESKSYLVVMNTVRDAQEIYSELKDEIGHEVDVKLIHSRFTVEDRNIKEKEILNDGNYKDFKRKSKKSVIWVSTQVVEASLDIDFDYLFTELSDLLSLFQRMGRVYRKRIIAGGDTNVFIFTEIRDSLIKNGERGFIDRGLYELSKEALKEQGDGIISELDKKRMIDEYFTSEKLEEKQRQNRSYFLKEYYDNYNYVKDLSIGSLDPPEVERKFRNIVSFKAIPESFVYGDKQGDLNSIIAKMDDITETIKKAEDEIEKKGLNKELLKLKEEVNKFTLNVDPTYLSGSYDFIDYKYDKIKVIKHKYDSDTGLQREKNNIWDDTIIW